MALVDLHHAFITLGDSRQKTTTVRFRVPSTEANLYLNALTQILKDGTDVGQLLLSIEDLSQGVLIGKGVMLETIEDAVVWPAPDANVYNFDKLMVHYAAGGNNYHFTIPARDDAVYLVASDGVTVRQDAPAAVTQLISRFNALVLSKYGVASTITDIEVSS